MLPGNGFICADCVLQLAGLFFQESKSRKQARAELSRLDIQDRNSTDLNYELFEIGGC
jgi:hypothetical protein